MVKSIFVPLTGFDSDYPALEAAISVAKNFGAQIQCLHVRVDPESALALMTREATWKIERQEGERSQKARTTFEEARKRHDLAADDVGAVRKGVAMKWHEVEGFPLPEAVYHGRMNDLVAVARDAPLLPQRIAEIEMRTGRPVLIAPAKPSPSIGETIAIAWKDTPESARAVTAAMPFLLKAKKVFLLTVQEDTESERDARQSLDELRARLNLHGIAAETLVLTEVSVSASETLLTVAYNHGCDTLVMGAYGHSRLREYVLVGVTQDMLIECALPLLVFH
jgi:nucleotide-binding universal stress UspA family protein